MWFCDTAVRCFACPRLPDSAALSDSRPNLVSVFQGEDGVWLRAGCDCWETWIRRLGKRPRDGDYFRRLCRFIRPVNRPEFLSLLPCVGESTVYACGYASMYWLVARCKEFYLPPEASMILWFLSRNGQMRVTQFPPLRRYCRRSVSIRHAGGKMGFDPVDKNLNFWL